jgi:topoisomerase-4 subunit A
VSNHYDNNVDIIEKFDPAKVWTAALFDADQQNYPYLKRFSFEASSRKQNYMGENRHSKLILLTDEYYPRLEVVFGGADSFREAMVVEADEFIGIKSFKAKGKRLTTYEVETINELEPTKTYVPQEPAPTDGAGEPAAADEPVDPDANKSDGDIIDEITGQMKLSL